MTRLPAIVVGISIFVSGLILGWPTSGTANGPGAAAPPALGKYLVVTGADNRLILVDTSTGNCWMTSTDAPTDWINLESPFSKAAKQQFVKPVD